MTCSVRLEFRYQKIPATKSENYGTYGCWNSVLTSQAVPVDLYCDINISPEEIYSERCTRLGYTHTERKLSVNRPYALSFRASLSQNLLHTSTRSHCTRRKRILLRMRISKPLLTPFTVLVSASPFVYTGRHRDR